MEDPKIKEMRERAEAYINKQEFKDLAEDDKIFAAYIAGSEEERAIINAEQQPTDKKQPTRNAAKLKELKNLVTLKIDYIERQRLYNNNIIDMANKLGFKTEVEARTLFESLLSEVKESMREIIQKIK